MPLSATILFVESLVAPAMRAPRPRGIRERRPMKFLQPKSCCGEETAMPCKISWGFSLLRGALGNCRAEIVLLGTQINGPRPHLVRRKVATVLQLTHDFFVGGTLLRRERGLAPLFLFDASRRSFDTINWAK